MRVAYLGPAGTFSEEALRRLAPEDALAVAYPTVHDSVMAVQEGSADRAVVPIENSLEGSVSATLDALAGEADRVRIVGELHHRVRHCLIAARPLSLAEVRRVVSHPQALAQCARYLREHLPDAELITAGSTADAARTIAASAEPLAAIGSHLAAEEYGCQVLAEAIADRDDNVTRFVWLAPVGARQPEPERSGERASGAAPGIGAAAGALKTSVVFWGFNDGAPGALVGVLGEFSERGINLTRIESRPRRARLGRYMFFADLEGGEHDAEVAAALSALRERVDTLRVLGSYRAAG